MYTSNELTHFVGREFTLRARKGEMSVQDAQNAQFGILVRKILGPEPRLIYKGHDPERPATILKDRQGSVCDETRYRPSTV